MNDQIPQTPAWLPDGSGLWFAPRTEFNSTAVKSLGLYPDGKFIPSPAIPTTIPDVSVAASGHVIATILGEIAELCDARSSGSAPCGSSHC